MALTAWIGAFRRLSTATTRRWRPLSFHNGHMTDAVADALARFGLPVVLVAVARYGPEWSREVREWMDRRDRRRPHDGA